MSCQKFLIAPLVLICLQSVIAFEIDFCFRPPALTLWAITPQLHVYTKEKETSQIFGADSELTGFVDQLEQDGYFRPNRRVIFLVHGYFWTPMTAWPLEMKEALMSIDEEDSMVVLLVWPIGADVMFYFGESASSTQTVADFLANFALAILNSKTFKGDKNLLYLHCIGHSLGAHVCGQAGRQAGIFDRATGLDPAGPGFEKCHDHLNIDKDSADCVDNIHTDGTSEGHSIWNIINDLGVNHFGTMKEWGHIDFYPNNGANQPGCNGFTSFPGCSHNRVTDLFLYTIKNGPNVCHVASCFGSNGEPCANKHQPMGYYSSCHSDKKDLDKGMFYLATESADPFC